jgi:hypothetical protein
VNARVRVVVLLFAVAVVVVAANVLTRGSGIDTPVPEARDPLLPDLVSLPLPKRDFYAGTNPEDGTVLLRFTSSIANTGDGPLIVDGERADGNRETWRVVQWFDEPEGERSGVVTGANLVYGGHGHQHWHLQFGASYRLLGDQGRVLASQTKAGFCFFDQEHHAPKLDGSPEEGVFVAQGCGKDTRATKVEMGMSVGWEDPYYWQLEDQSVEITDVPDGKYRLEATADPDNWLTEADEDNNMTWVSLELGTNSEGLRTVEVLDSAEE